ncbi:MAG TPA: 30S ribosomal protein THX [Gemmatimonadales bacterium]|nr:30S ribosomal protein THX [Gemmatimonadales bacterium]
MGKGDRKTRQGKIFRHTYGKRRPRHEQPSRAAPTRQGRPATTPAHPGIHEP